MDSTVKILQQINQLKTDLKPDHLQSTQISYLRRFIYAHKKPLILFLLLALLEALLLIGLPLMVRLLLEKDYNLFLLDNLLFDSALLTLVVLFYILTAYWLIRLDQNISFSLINQIKLHWLSYFYETPSSHNSELSDGSLLTKFVYHTQLLKMALEKSVMEGSRAVIFYLVILVSAFLFSSSAFLKIFLGFPLLCLVFYIFYRIGRYYVSREQTLNTRLVKSLVHQAANLYQIKQLGLEKERFHMIGLLLEQDTFFRKRREIWIRFSDRVVFSLVLLSGGLAYLFKDFYPVFSFESWGESAISIILAGFYVKILMQAGHAGMFWQALKTGLLVSIPDFAVTESPRRSGPKIDFAGRILVYGKKVKLSKFGGVIPSFQLEIPPASGILIVSEGSYGKSTLAKFLCGLGIVESLNVKNGNFRLLSHYWSENNLSRHFISFSPVYQETLAEYLFAKPADEISQEDLESVFVKLQKYPQFEFIFRYKDFLSKRLNSFVASRREMFLLQIAGSILHSPGLICIDHDVFDLPGTVVSENLNLLRKLCPQASLVCFSGSCSHSMKFDQTYLLTDREFKKT